MFFRRSFSLLKTTLLVLFLSFLFFSAKTQTVTLAVNQPLPPDTPAITQTGNTLTSSALTGNQWWKGGSEITGATAQTLAITESGDYMVVVTDSVTGCSSQSATCHAVVTNVAVIDAAAFQCTVYPNPGNGSFTVEVKNSDTEPMQLELISANGSVIARKQLNSVAGNQIIQFGKENMAKGIYTLRVRYGTETMNRKLVVE